MKKILKYILFITIFISSGFAAQEVFADETQCRIKDNEVYIAGNFNNKNFQELEEKLKPQLMDLLFNGKLPIILHSKFADQISCAGKEASFVIIGINGEKAFTYNFPSEIAKTNGVFNLDNKEITIEKSKICNKNMTGSGNNCSFSFKVESENGSISSISTTGENKDKGQFFFKCEGTQCDGNFNIIISGPEMDENTDAVIDYNDQQAIANCELTKDDIHFSPYSNVITDSNIKLIVDTKDKCENTNIKIKLWEYDKQYYGVKNSAELLIPGVALEIVALTKLGISHDTIDIELDNSSTTELKVKTPIDKNLEISFYGNDDDCDEFIPHGDSVIMIPFNKAYKWVLNNNCQIYVEIEIGNKTISTEEYIEKGSNSNGIIRTNCGENGDCREYEENDWELYETNGSIDGFKNDGAQQAEVTRPKYDKDSPCYVAEGGDIGENKIANEKNGYYKLGCYEFLAPIQGIEKKADGTVDTARFKVTDDGRIAILDIRTYELGDYINKLFQIAIAILGVLAVIMIIVAGVQYMTVESITGKSNARERIVGAVSGLLLSLGIFIILNTINPQLLKINFGSKLNIVGVGIEPEGNVSFNNTTTSVVDEKTYILINDKTDAVLKNISGITCDGSTLISDVAKSFVGKTTYRFGAKGGTIPDSQGRFLLDGGTLSNKKCEEGKRCGDFCPTGQVCLDCSGFVYYVLECSGNTKHDVELGSEGLFNKNKKHEDSIEIKSFKKESGKYYILKPDNEKYELQIGDLIGSPSNHVSIYIGDGKIAHSAAGGNGRNKGKGVRISDLSSQKIPDGWIKFVRPYSTLH